MICSILFLFTLLVICDIHVCLQHVRNGTHHRNQGISYMTLAGKSVGCRNSTIIETTTNIKFFMCVGQNEEDLNNGMAIIRLIKSRRNLPTCRVMQLMMWMLSEVREDRFIPAREVVVDIGANIGSCAVTMASLGFHVIAVEPVINHIQTIQGSIDINPTFRIDLHHAGISHEAKIIQPIFFSGKNNWGSTMVEEYKTNNRSVDLPLKTVKQIVGNRDVAMIKIDCEGCEWSALLGAKEILNRVPMIKIEVISKSYTAGNDTISQKDLLVFLKARGYDIFIDMWNEADFYFGRHANVILDTDRMFGNNLYNLTANETFLHVSAQHLLRKEIADPDKYERRNYAHLRFSDIIAIERKLANQMRLRFGAS